LEIAIVITFLASFSGVLVSMRNNEAMMEDISAPCDGNGLQMSVKERCQEALAAE